MKSKLRSVGQILFPAPVTAFAAAITLMLAVSVSAQESDVYEVYAIEYVHAGKMTPVKEIAVNTQSRDSVRFAFYFWYLKGMNGKQILVDAGFVEDSAKPGPLRLEGYQRPDLALQRIGVRADDITDVIVTHPHSDHIGGVSLFRNAAIWMQKSDYAFFVGDAWQARGRALGYKKDDVRRIVEANLDGRLRLVDGDSMEIMPGIRVFTGSKHTYGCQHVLVNTASEKVMLASDDAWFYVNIDIPASIPATSDTVAYLRQLRRMRTLVSNPDLIIPGHDALVLSRFPAVAEGVVRIR